MPHKKARGGEGGEGKRITGRQNVITTRSKQRSPGHEKTRVWNASQKATNGGPEKQASNNVGTKGESDDQSAPRAHVRGESLRLKTKSWAGRKDSGAKMTKKGWRGEKKKKTQAETEGKRRQPV